MQDKAQHLHLHEKLARRRVWARKLWAASGLACALSFGLWLFAVPVPWHLGATFLCFALGLLTPLPSAHAWSLDWIGRSGGLSYQTALELGETGDAYGFGEAVKKRALTQAARLELPEQQAWWLPLLLVAIVLALLPIVPFRTGTRLPFDTGPVQTDRRPDPTPDPEAEAAAVEQGESDETSKENPTAEQPDGEQSAASTIENFDAPGGASPEANSERVADAETLERFLENMRERPQPEEQDNPFRSVTPQPRQGQQRAENAGEERIGSESADGEQGESQETGPSGESGNQQAGEESAEEGEQGDEGGPQGEESADAPSGDSGESSEEAGGSSADGEQGAEEQGLLEEGEGQDGTGQLPGPLSLQETEDLGEPQSDPEQLRGQLQRGPSNLAGTVRLPGSAESEIGPATAPGSFNQTQEQAITEGRIPVEYQEIIRNYFR